MVENNMIPELNTRDCAAWLSQVKEMLANKDERLLTLRTRFEERVHALKALQTRLSAATKARDDAMKKSAAQISALKRSTAYRVGMAVTWPGRKVLGGIKCLRENGVKYTLKHAVGKVLFWKGGRQK